MSEMTEVDRSKVAQDTMVDELAKRPQEYEYASDVLAAQCAYPYSIWAEPNSTIKGVIEGDIDYDSLPYDAQNEVEKGTFFQEQAEFVAKHAGKTILCEALAAQPCLLEQCPLYVPAYLKRHGQPICREWNFTFAK